MSIAVLDLPQRDAAHLVSSGAPVYLCVDPVEYHGPHLSLHNDRQLSRGAVAALGARLSRTHDWPILHADHLELGVEPCPGPGSRMLDFSTVRDAVVESCRALAELGAQRVVVMTFHGSPLHNLAIDAGVQWLRKAGVRAIAPFNAVLQRMLLLDDTSPYDDAFAHVPAADDRATVARELRFDFHAGFFETSLALHWAPDSVSPRHRELPPCPAYPHDGKLGALAKAARKVGRESTARELELAAAAVGWTALRPFPGYTGRPHLANAASGAAFAEHLVAEYVQLVEDALVGDAPAPEPIVRWARWATADGRLLAQRRLGRADVLAL